MAQRAGVHMGIWAALSQRRGEGASVCISHVTQAVGTKMGTPTECRLDARPMSGSYAWVVWINARGSLKRQAYV
jgi:hypothetical protein